MPMKREVDKIGHLIRIKAFRADGSLKASMSFGDHLENDVRQQIEVIEFFERNRGPKDCLEDIGMRDTKHDMVVAALGNITLEELRKM